MILKNHFWMLWQLGVFGIDKKVLKNKKTAVHLVNAQQFIMSYYPRYRWYGTGFQVLYSKSSARNSAGISSRIFLATSSSRSASSLSIYINSSEVVSEANFTFSSKSAITISCCLRMIVRTSTLQSGCKVRLVSALKVKDSDISLYILSAFPRTSSITDLKSRSDNSSGSTCSPLPSSPTNLEALM